MTYAVLDSFNRGDEIITASANWASVNQGCAPNPDDLWVISNQCGPLNGNPINDVYWKTAMGSNDHEVGLTYVTGSKIATSSIELWVRVSNPGAANLTGYFFEGVWTGSGIVFTGKIYRYDDCSTRVLLSTVSHTLGDGEQIRLQIVGSQITYTHSGGHSQTITDATYTTGKYIGFGAYGNGTLVEDFGGGDICTALTSASIAGNANSSVSTNQTLTASYLPADATIPVTYTWSATGLVSGQGTAIAVYNFSTGGNKTITVTLTNSCAVNVTATHILTVIDTNRESGRDQLATILTTALGSYVQNVYNYYIGDFKNKTSVVIVTSNASQHPKMSLQGRRTMHRYQVVVYVLYAKSGEWTELQAEDRLDLLEKLICTTINTYSCNRPYWIALELANENGYSVIDYVPIGGVEYKRETFTVNMEV